MAASAEIPASPVAPLGRPPEEGVRLLALSFLDQAAAARPRLADAEDTEALHDFRVALRRLRSCLKAYSAYLDDSLPRKLAKRLRRLADATGGGRDTEVEIEWLRGESKSLAGVHRPGYAWLLARLEERKSAAYAELNDEVAEDFSRVEADLRRRLSVYRTEVRLDREAPRRTLGAAVGTILRDEVEDLERHLAKVDGPGAENEAHQARIRAKRLRYLLEPWKENVPGVPPVVQRIKALQDLLGELHDAHVLEHELSAAVARAAAERAGKLYALTLEEAPDGKLLAAERRRRHEPGLLALAKRNRSRRDRLFSEVARGWLDGRAAGFLRQVEALETAFPEAGGAGGAP